MKQGDLFTRSELDGPKGPEALEKIRTRVLSCTRCRLHESRINAVFGSGKADSPMIAFVGEGPGADEDVQGLPFVGRSGKLLEGMLRAMGLTKEEVYICNAVACRPPENRKPLPDELAECKGYLIGQLLAVSPRCIVTLGATALQVLIRTKKNMGDMRGKWLEWGGIPVLPTYHPAYLLRDPSKKRDTWTDLQLVATKLGIVVPS
jgi:uracil-DNA glycosylase family 4